MKATSPPKKRNLRPKPAVSANPVAISDQTSWDLLGLDGPQFRKFLKDNQVPSTVQGHRVIARTDHVLATLDRLAAQGEDVSVSANVEEIDQPTSAASVLALLGLRAAS